MAFENIEWVYSNSACNTVRYVLGKKASNTIACIGINPSTASPNDLDNTLKSVKRIAAFNGYDGWVMYNLYPQRSTDPSLLDKEVNHHLRLKNSYAIKQSILELKIDTIWLAFGNLIESRTYLSLCMLSIHENLKDLNLNWKIIGVPTKKGHPAHPLYRATKSELKKFNVENYVNTKLKPIIHQMKQD